MTEKTREFEKVYEQEKVKSKSLDKKVAEFREDILKVNSEKHKIFISWAQGGQP